MDKKSSMLQILSLFSHEQRISHHHSDLLKFVSTLSVPIITQEKLKAFSQTFDETHDLIASLISFHDIFTFDPANLQKIISFNQTQNKDILKAAPYIYMNGIAFILSFSNASTFDENFTIVLNSIFSVSYYDFKNSFFLYFLILEYFMENSSSLIKEDNIRLICSHICIQTKPNIKFYNILIEMLLKIKACENCLDQIFPTFALILQIFAKKKIEVDVSILCDYVSRNILNVKYQVFEVILVLSKRREDDNVKKIYRLLPKSIKEFMNDKPLPITADLTDKTADNQEQYEYNYNDSLLTIQSDGILESDNYPEIYDCSEFSDTFYDIPVQNFLNFVVAVLASDIKKPYLNAFMQSYEQLFTEQFEFNFFLSFLFILSKIKCHFYLSQKILDLIFDKNIFNPMITVFNSSIIDRQKIFLLRNVIIKIAFQFCKHGATYFFKKSENYPFIFTELLLRSVKFDMSKLYNDTFLNSFCKVYFELIEIDSKKENKNISKRPILFLFMKFLLEIPSLPFHELHEFSKETEKLIISVINEKSFKTTIFSQMKKYLYSNKYSEFNPTCNQLGNLLILINQTAENSGAIKEYLSMYYDAIQKNDCLKMSPSSVNLLNSFITFIEHHPNEENVIKVLKILALYNKDVIDNWVLHRLSITIPIALEKSLNDEVVFVLFSLVSSAVNNSFPNFLIENGKPFHFIFSIFSFFNRTFDLLKIINNICDYSTCNRIRLHECEFDILLLDILINYPNDFIFKECKIVNITDSYFDLLFEIFAKISVTKSNQIVTDRLIKVICHSKMSERFLKFFIPIENLARKYAVSKYPLGIQQLYFEADNISEDTIKQGFSIAFWIFVDNPISEKLKIKATVLTGMNFFQLTICESLLYLSDVNNNILQTFPIRSQHWNAVILNFHDDNVVAYVNKNFVTRKIKLTTLNSKNTFTFGNEIDNQSDIDELLSVYSIAKFSIYTKELSVNEIDQFISQSLDLQPLYSFPLDLNNPPLQSATMYIDMNGFIPRLENISDSLNYTYPIENIIPLFSQLDKFEHRILILNAFENLFQKRLISLGEIIAHLLNQNDSSIFNFHLYSSFYSFLKKQNENENLFDSLIINCDLWSNSSISDLIKIVIHWRDILFTEYESLFYRKKFFPRFLSEIRIMFDTLSNNKNIDPKEIDFVIQPCLDLIELIANNEFDDSCSSLLLKTIIKSNNYEFASRLINILPNLLTHLISSQLTLKIVELILCIDFNKFKNSFHALIQSLSVFSQLQFYYSTVILGYNIPSDFDYKYFSEDLIEFPELTFICLKAALKTTEENQQKLGNLLLKIIESDENKKLFLTFEMWFIWPVIFALQTNEIEIISFFITSIICSDYSKEIVGNIFSFIDLLGVQTTLNAKELKCSLIKGLYELLNVDIQNQNQADLLELGFECLYSTCLKSQISLNLYEEYKNSPFNENDFNISKPYSGFIYSLKDLKTVLEIDFIVYSYYLQIVNISHFTKTVKAFYHIFLPIAKSASEGVAYLIKLICSLSPYPESEPIEAKDYLINGTKLVQFVSNLKKRTQNFTNQLIEFFKKAEKPLQEIESLKNKISDPLIDVYKEKELKFITNKKEWKRILKRFVHPNAAFNIDCFEWERDFFMTPDFVSNKLKRRIKSLKQENYHYPYQIIENINNNNIKTKSLLLSKNLVSKSSSSKLISSSIIASYSCLLIKINKITSVSFNLYAAKIEIITNKKTIRIKLYEIRDILTRSRFQKKTAIEFFLMNGKSYLLDFAPTFSSTIFKQFSGLNFPSLRAKETDNYSSFINNSGIVKKWQDGKISTYDFLMKLNMSCGRSFHDSENYIIFPWVVAFPDSKHLRNFDRPMPAQTDSRLNYYKKKIQLNQEMPEMSSFLFGSAPSNAMLLSYYFVRMQPFTSLHLKVHDGKFDVMDRIFRSVDNFFSGMASSDDSRESAPEFYSMPEMFFDLDKINIDDQPNESKNNDDNETVAQNNELNVDKDESKTVNNIELNDNNNNVKNEQNDNLSKQSEELNENDDEQKDKHKFENNEHKEEQNEESQNDKEKPILQNDDQNAQSKHHKNEEDSSLLNNESSTKEENPVQNQTPQNKELNLQDMNSNKQNETEQTTNLNQQQQQEPNENSTAQIETGKTSQSDQQQQQEPNENSTAQIETGKTSQSDQQQQQEPNESITTQNSAEQSTLLNQQQQQQEPNESVVTQNDTEQSNSTANAQLNLQEESINSSSSTQLQLKEDNSNSALSSNSNTQLNLQEDNSNSTLSSNSNTNLKEDDEDKESSQQNEESDSQNDELLMNTQSDDLSFHNDESSSDTENDNISHEDFNISHDLFDCENDFTKNDTKNNDTKIGDDDETKTKEENEQSTHEEDFIGDLEVPSWSNNSIYDFVYQLRKILESDEISDQINKWIDLLFGLSQRGEEAIKRCNIYIPYIYEDVWNDKKAEEEEMIMALLRSLGSMPPIVFKEKVGPKNISNFQGIQNRSINIEYEHQIKRGFPFMTAINKCHIIAINCLGSIERVSIDFNKNIKSLNSKENFLNPTDHIITLYHNTVVYIIDCKNSKVSSVSTEAIMTKKVQNLENVEFIDPGIYEHTFYTTSKTGSVYLWNSNKLDSPQLVLSVFSDSLKAATVSQKFGVFVYATNNGYVEIYSLNSKRFINSVYLDGFVGQKVVVTPKLGLIVVKTLKKIWVLTINGFVIKKVPFMHHLNVFTMWSSAKGIDYISVSDSNGNVWSFEAYYPEKATIVKSCHDAIVGIEYDQINNCLLIVTMKPKLHIVSI